MKGQVTRPRLLTHAFRFLLKKKRMYVSSLEINVFSWNKCFLSKNTADAGITYMYVNNEWHTSSALKFQLFVRPKIMYLFSWLTRSKKQQRAFQKPIKSLFWKIIKPVSRVIKLSRQLEQLLASSQQPIQYLATDCPSQGRVCFLDSPTSLNCSKYLIQCRSL